MVVAGSLTGTAQGGAREVGAESARDQWRRHEMPRLRLIEEEVVECPCVEGGLRKGDYIHRI